MFTILAKNGHLWTMNYVFQLIWCVPCTVLFDFDTRIVSYVLFQHTIIFESYLHFHLPLYDYLLLLFLRPLSPYIPIVTATALKWPWSCSPRLTTKGTLHSSGQQTPVSGLDSSDLLVELFVFSLFFLFHILLL